MHAAIGAHCSRQALSPGGALFGVFAAITRFAGFEYTTPGSMELTQILGCVAYLLLIGYLIWDSCRAKE